MAVGVLGAGAVAGHRSGAMAGPVPGAPPWRLTAPSGPARPWAKAWSAAQARRCAGQRRKLSPWWQPLLSAAAGRGLIAHAQW